jgi:hypothetical protein
LLGDNDQRGSAVDTPSTLREEARVCRELMREITDLASIGMLRDRAQLLEQRAAALERRAPDDDIVPPGGRGASRHGPKRRSARS